MSFNERLKNYRYNELQIKSKEAAAILGLEPAHYSHYETGRNKFPIDLLPSLKEKFMMSDDVFLEVLLQRPRKRQTVKEMAVRSRELQEAYLTKFGEDYFDFIGSPEIRTLLAVLKHSDPEVFELRMKAISDLMDKSPAFRKSAKAGETSEFLHPEIDAPSKPLYYKLNKQQSFALIDGTKWPSLFMKTDDRPIDEDVNAVHDVKNEANSSTNKKAD